MNVKEAVKKAWEYLKKDTWDSWLVSIILVVIFIKFVFFPILSLITAASLPLVVVESCSMYHEADYPEWWAKSAAWYENNGLTRADFDSFSFQGGLNKGDIIITWGRAEYKKGDVIIYSAPTKYPIIHRIISDEKIATKGDHNPSQLYFEEEISKEQIIGKAIARIPLAGWLKLIFFEPFRPSEQRGFCK